jgi:predicted Rossmann fold nucleotide-binding protein DprA/Smf involved in DNA uptake
MSEENKSDKAALKKLREERAWQISRAKETVKTQQQIIKRITEQIKNEGKTVPEIVQATGLPASQVLMFVATLRKYGAVAEGTKDGDYFRYQISN